MFVLPSSSGSRSPKTVSAFSWKLRSTRLRNVSIYQSTRRNAQTIWILNAVTRAGLFIRKKGANRNQEGQHCHVDSLRDGVEILQQCHDAMPVCHALRSQRSHVVFWSDSFSGVPRTDVPPSGVDLGGRTNSVVQRSYKTVCRNKRPFHKASGSSTRTRLDVRSVAMFGIHTQLLNCSQSLSNSSPLFLSNKKQTHYQS
jgi:hypothetical protein